ncbi:hypothetical protein, partial [Neisseria sicca]|uniref:hypothetical protein n=1 Tax=Neisseria sicca TaxID=490 RepID=UPI001C9A1968
MINKGEDLMGGGMIVLRSRDMWERKIGFMGNEVKSMLMKRNVRERILVGERMEKRMFWEK